MESGPALKVMILFSSAELGGAERSLSRMALADGQSDIRYLLATLGGEGAWARWLRSVGREPLVLPVLERGLPSFAGMVRLLRVIRTHAPAIIYVVGLRAAVLIRLLKPWLGRAKVVHGIRSTYRRGSRLARTFAVPERMLQGLTDCYIANSRQGAESLAELCGIPRTRFEVIPNGVAIPEGIPPPFGGRPKEIAVVANLNEFKGHREFLDVVLAVNKCHGDAVFSFIGRDDMDGEIQRLAAAKGLAGAVRFLGFQHDVWPWLVASRLSVLPSRETEGAPTAIIEAHAAGLPVVAFAVGGIGELIRDNIDGRLIVPGDDDALANAIIALLDDPIRAAQMGLAGRDKVIESSTLGASARRHAEVWRSLASLQ